MKIKKGFKKISQIIVIFLLVILVLNPVTISKNIEKQKKEKITDVDNFENMDIKIYQIKPEETSKIKNLLTEVTQILLKENNIEKLLEIINTLNDNQNSIINDIINFIMEKITSNTGNRLSLFKKTFVISQGWSYNFNFYKNSVFQLKRNSFTFWHYNQGSKSGGESKTLILRPDGMFSKRSTEIFIGKQTGFMMRPKGIYIYEANMFPKPSYTFFIGFANYAYAFGEEKIELNLPLN